MKRSLQKSCVIGSVLLLVCLLFGPTAWGQHGGGHGGGGHGGGGHSFGGGHGYGGGGHGYGGGGHGYGGGGHGYGYGGHGYGYGGHSFGDSIVHGLGHSIGHSIGHGLYGGYGYGGGHYLADFGHHVVYPHYDHYAFYGGYYPSYGVVSAVPYNVVAVDPRATSRTRIAGPAPVANRNVVNKPAVGNGNGANSASVAAYLDSAEKAFQGGDFSEAARLTSHALVESPNNLNAHLFLSHALFASGDYRGAAIEVHRAASIDGIDGMGYHVKNWKAIYRNTQYTDAMKRLNKVVSDNPNDAALRFLRGYHFMYLNQTDYAKRELAKAVELEPKDRLAADLLNKLSGKSIDPLELPAPPTATAPNELLPEGKLPADTAPDLTISNRSKRDDHSGHSH